MAKRLLSGGEAIAYAALASGASVVAGYPTDSLSQLVEAAIRQVAKRNASGAHAQWTVNDKTTLGMCAAASISGLRALAAFGQTGFSETIQGIASLSDAQIQGGLVVVVADESPSDAFTLNLDVRRICELAKIPVIDPATPAQAFSAVSAAFILSERYSMPVVIHMSSDINHSSTFFDIHPHTKASSRKGAFLKNKDSLDMEDLLAEDSRDCIDVSGNDLSDTDARLKEIAYRFSYKDTFAVYNRIHEFEQQYEGKHNSNRLLKEKGQSSKDTGDMDTDKLDIAKDSTKRMTLLDESNIKIGICVCGSAAPYAIEAIETLRKEAHKSKVSAPYIRLLTLGTPYPVPKRTLRKFLDGLNDILVIEEFSSFAEEELIKQCATSFLGPNVHGRFTDEVNYNYPVNFESIILHIATFIDKCLNVKPEKKVLAEDAEASLSPVVNLGKHSSPADNSKSLTPKQSRTLTGIARRLASPESIYTYNYEIPERLPVLCSGCPHRASFYTIDKALAKLKMTRNDIVVSGDIGCSLLGNNPPLNFLDACLGEGFSTSLAQGFSIGMPASAENAKSIAVLGDSSFFANAIPGITNAIVSQIDVTIIVLDNKTCAESGLQSSPTSFGTTDIADVLRSLGIQNVREANPFEISNAVDSCVKAIRDTRPSAVVLSSKCARLVRSEKTTFINVNKCTGCKECITQLGCPAISFDKSIVGKKSGMLGQAVIDINQCNGCRLCVHVCPSEAIRVMMHKDVAELIKQERYRSAKNVEADAASLNEKNTDATTNAKEGADNPSDEQESPIINLFSSGPLVLLDDKETADADSSSTANSGPNGKPYKSNRSKVSKESAQADFGALFGGRNAELRLDFDNKAEILEEEFEARQDNEDSDTDAIKDEAFDTDGDTEKDDIENADDDEIEGNKSESNIEKDSLDSDNADVEDDAPKDAEDDNDIEDASADDSQSDEEDVMQSNDDVNDDEDEPEIADDELEEDERDKK